MYSMTSGMGLAIATVFCSLTVFASAMTLKEVMAMTGARPTKYRQIVRMENITEVDLTYGEGAKSDGKLQLDVSRKESSSANAENQPKQIEDKSEAKPSGSGKVTHKSIQYPPAVAVQTAGTGSVPAVKGPKPTVNAQPPPPPPQSIPPSISGTPLGQPILPPK